MKRTQPNWFKQRSIARQSSRVMECKPNKPTSTWYKPSKAAPKPTAPKPAAPTLNVHHVQKILHLLTRNADQRRYLVGAPTSGHYFLEFVNAAGRAVRTKVKAWIVMLLKTTSCVMWNGQGWLTTPAAFRAVVS